MKEGVKMASWKRNLMICWLGCFTTATGMSLVIPFLSFYIEELGVTGTSSIAQWSGLAFGVTFLMGAIVSPIWGKLGDIHGRKLMLIRASLGMAVIMTLMGFVTDVYQLVALRFLMGAVSGFLSTAMTFIASRNSGRAFRLGNFHNFNRGREWLITRTITRRLFV
ncbi:MFS transporter [Bacillus toyonensis]